MSPIKIVYLNGLFYILYVLSLHWESFGKMEKVKFEVHVKYDLESKPLLFREKTHQILNEINCGFPP